MRRDKLQEREPYFSEFCRVRLQAFHLEVLSKVSVSACGLINLHCDQSYLDIQILLELHNLSKEEYPLRKICELPHVSYPFK